MYRSRWRRRTKRRMAALALPVTTKRPDGGDGVSAPLEVDDLDLIAIGELEYARAACGH